MSRRAHHGLQTVEQAKRSVGQNTVTIVQSTVDHRTDDRVRRIKRQRAVTYSFTELPGVDAADGRA